MLLILHIPDENNINEFHNRTQDKQSQNNVEKVSVVFPINSMRKR